MGVQDSASPERAGSLREALQVDDDRLDESRVYSPRPCTLVARALSTLAHCKAPDCMPRLGRALALAQFLDRVDWAAFAGWAELQAGDRGLGDELRRRAEGWYARIQEIDNDVVVAVHSAIAAGVVGKDVLDALDMLNCAWTAASKARNRIVGRFSELLHREVELRRHLAEEAGSLAALAVELAEPEGGTLVRVTKHEPVLTAKQAGALLWPGESLGTKAVCDRLRPARAPAALLLFAPGGAGRLGRHFIARLVEGAARTARRDLEQVAQRSRQRQDDRRDASETRAYHARRAMRA